MGPNVPGLHWNDLWHYLGHKTSESLEVELLNSFYWIGLRGICQGLNCEEGCIQQNQHYCLEGNVHGFQLQTNITVSVPGNFAGEPSSVYYANCEHQLE